MNEDTLKPGLDRAQRWFLIVGVIASVACVFGAFTNWTGFLRGYLVGFLLWLLVALGCLAILCLHHLVGGNGGSSSGVRLKRAPGLSAAGAALCSSADRPCRPARLPGCDR